MGVGACSMGGVLGFDSSLVDVSLYIVKPGGVYADVADEYGSYVRVLRLGR